MAKEKTKHDGLLCFLLALIVVLILIIGGGAYYFLVVDNGENLNSNTIENAINSSNELSRNYKNYTFETAYGTVKIEANEALKCKGTAGASNVIFYLKDGKLYLYNHNSEDEIYADGVENIYYETAESQFITVKTTSKTTLRKENPYLDYGAEKNYSNEQIVTVTKTTQIEKYYNNDKTKSATLKQEVPNVNIANNINATNTINNYMKKIVDDKKAQLSSSISDSIKFLPDNFDDKGLGIEVLAEDSIIQEKILTWHMIQSGSMGGVGWNEERGYSFDVSTGKVITIDDMTTNKAEFIKIIKQNIKEQLDIKKVNYDKTTIDSNIDNVLGNSGSCYLSKIGFNCVFDKYSIADGATGVLNLTVPYNKLLTYMNQDYINKLNIK